MKRAIGASGAIGMIVLALVWGGAAETPVASGDEARKESKIDVTTLRVIPSESGETNYYSVIGQPTLHLHAEYRPPAATMVLGYEVPKKQRRSVAGIRWNWRAVTLPEGGDECTQGKGDSAAVIYVTWKRGLKWYTLKYVWSAVSPKGQTCDEKSNIFREQQTVIVDSGPPLNQWRTVKIDPDAEFRNHFEEGKPDAKVPDIIGFGVMTDGDQTKSISAADYAEFVITWK